MIVSILYTMHYIPQFLEILNEEHSTELTKLFHKILTKMDDESYKEPLFIKGDILLNLLGK